MAGNTTGPDSLYKEQYCKDIIKWGKSGDFPVKWASRIGVSKQTLSRWRQKFPEFKEAWGIAKTHAESKLTDKSMEGDSLDLAKGKWYLSACFGVSETNKQQIQAEIAEAPEIKVDFGDRE
jgi:transposase-like protein